MNLNPSLIESQVKLHLMLFGFRFCIKEDAVVGFIAERSEARVLISRKMQLC